MRNLRTDPPRPRTNTKARKDAPTGAASEKGSERRQRILLAARQRFAASGFETTTVRQIAGDVGLLAGSLYYHFANKEEMLHETVRDVVQRLRDGAEAIQRSEGDPEAKLVALIFFDVDERTIDHEVHVILHQERAYFRHNPDLAYVLSARREHYLAWRSILEQGIAEGYFRGDINVFLTLSTIIRMLNTAADWYLHDNPATKDAAGILSRNELSAFYVNFVLRAVRKPARIEVPVPWPVGYPGSREAEPG